MNLLDGRGSRVLVHQEVGDEARDYDRRKRMPEGDMPSTWGGGSGMVKEDSRFRRDEGFRGGRGDTWIASRDGPLGGDRERRPRSRSPLPPPKDPDPQPQPETEVKYGRR